MSSWKEHLRSWLKPESRRKGRRDARLNVQTLEDRVTPVVGSFDVPYAVDFDTTVGATNLTGVVQYFGGPAGQQGTGTLLDRGSNVVGSRHVLIAAHLNPAVGDTVSFYSRAADGTVKTIDIPVIDVKIDPLFNAGTRANDIAIVTLAAVAPQYAADYPIYLGSNGSEISKPYFLAGYGLPGTGTSGQSSKDLQRLTVTATGGFYALSTPTNGTTSPIAFNSTPAQVQAALTAIGLNNVQVLSPQFGPFTTKFSTLPAPPIVNAFYSYEIRDASLANLERLQYVPVLASPLVDGGNNGVVAITTLTNGTFDSEFQRLTINGTAGTFKLGLSGVFTTPLAFDATEAQIQTALQTLAGVTEVTVRKIPVGAASGAGSFQIAFDRPTTGFPVIAVNATALSGTASAYILQNGTRQVLRLGVNEYGGASGSFLTSDFDTDGTDSFPTTGDDGGPGFIDIGGGNLAVASLVSLGGGTTFSKTQMDTRVSKFTSGINAYINAPGYAAVVDMQYQLGGNDGIPDTFHVTQTAAGRVEVYVKDSKAGPERLFYADDAVNMASVVLRGTNDDETFIIDSSVTVLVSIEGGGGKNTVIGPSLNTAWNFTGVDKGTGNTASTDFNFKGIRNVVGGTGNDSFSFAVGGSLSGSIDGGADTDTIDFSSQAKTNVVVTATGTIDGAVGTITGSVPLAGQFRNIDNIVGAMFGTTDKLTGPDTGGVWTHNGIGGVYVDGAATKSFAYSNFEVLNGGLGNDTYNIVLASKALSVVDVGGTDASNVSGTAGNDAVTLSLTAASGSSGLIGLVQPIAFSGVETVNFDGKAGNNSYRFQDQTGLVYGSPTDPGSGIVYAPSGAAAGIVRVGSSSNYGVAAINSGLTVDGGNTGSTFLVLGTSGPGIQSGFGEAIVGNGQDLVTITDTAIAISSVSAGDLLGVSPAYTNGAASFATIYVATGNEPLNQGDVITVTPSFNVNLLVNAQGPATSARPGDRASVAASSTTTNAFVNNPALGPPQNRVTQTSDGAAVGLIGIESGVTPSPVQGMIAVATDASPGGPETTVQVYDRVTGALRFQVVPFPGFFGGASVASGDVNGDGFADLIVGAGAGGGPRVAIFNGIDGSLITDFFGYEETFRGGVNVSAADFNGDGKADIILGTGVGGGPRVRIVSGADFTTAIRDVFVYEDTFRGGVNVSAGDFNSDGVPDLATSAGPGGGPRLVVLSGVDLRQLASFFVFDPNSRAGFSAALADINGDGYADIVAGAGAGEPARVRVFSGLTRSVLADFFVNDPLQDGASIPSIQNDAGVRVSAADVNLDGIDDVITAKGPGSLPTVRVYQLGAVDPVTRALFPVLREIRHFDTFDGGSAFGLNVGGSD